MLRKRKNVVSYIIPIPESPCIQYIDSFPNAMLRDAMRDDATCPCYFVQRSDGHQTDIDENSYVVK